MADENEREAKRYASSEDVYKELVDESEEAWLYGLVAFAVVEEQRIEWVNHQIEHTGAAPTPADVVAWYQQQPPGTLLRAKGTAENALKAYSDEVLGDIEQDAKDTVKQGILYSEIQELKKFGSNFMTNLTASIIGSLIFAFIIVILAAVLLDNSSLAELGRALNDK